MRFPILLLMFFLSIIVNGQNKKDDLGLKQGVWNYKNEEGAIIKKSEFYNDTLIGESLVYYNNGKVQSIRHYNMGVLDGKVITYDSKGGIIDQFSYKNGMLDGHLERYNQNLKLSANFMNGKLDGKFIIYDEKTKINSEIDFKNGCLVSGQRFFDSKGRLITLLVPNSIRDKFVLKVKFDKKGREKKSLKVNLFPDTVYLFGKEYHSSCDSNLNPLNK